MTKTFAAHLIDARNAVTAAETFSVVKVMGEKLTRNRDKVNWLHCCHGRAADAMHYSEKLAGWNRLYNEAVAIWRERSARLSTEEATAIVMNAYGITSLVTEPAA